jgi:membrane protein involved in colicin uptake
MVKVIVLAVLLAVVVFAVLMWSRRRQKITAPVPGQPQQLGGGAAAKLERRADLARMQ